MPACVYCGLDAGEYDEHAECVERALEQALDDEAGRTEEASQAAAELEGRGAGGDAGAAA